MYTKMDFSLWIKTYAYDFFTKQINELEAFKLYLSLTNYKTNFINSLKK